MVPCTHEKICKNPKQLYIFQIYYEHRHFSHMDVTPFRFLVPMRKFAKTQNNYIFFKYIMNTGIFSYGHGSILVPCTHEKICKNPKQLHIFQIYMNTGIFSYGHGSISVPCTHEKICKTKGSHIYYAEALLADLLFFNKSLCTFKYFLVVNLFYSHPTFFHETIFNFNHYSSSAALFFSSAAASAGSSKWNLIYL